MAKTYEQGYRDGFKDGFEAGRPMFHNFPNGTPITTDPNVTTPHWYTTCTTQHQCDGKEYVLEKGA